MLSKKVTFHLIAAAGGNREVKKAVEAYWAGKISADELVKAAADVRKTSWTSLKERGVDLIPRYGLTRSALFANVILTRVQRRLFALRPRSRPLGRV